MAEQTTLQAVKGCGGRGAQGQGDCKMASAEGKAEFLVSLPVETRVERGVDEAFRASPRDSLQPAEHQVVTGGTQGLSARWSHAPAAP